MVDNGIVTLPAGDVPSVSTNNFTVGAGQLDLTGYLRHTTRTYFYCWINTGRVTAQHDASGPCS